MMIKKIAGILFLLACFSQVFAETRRVTVSDFQDEFTGIVRDYSAQYQAAPNELKKSAVARKRSEALAQLKGDYGNIDGWFGTIERLGTDGDGNAYLTVNLLAAGVTVGTWNNGFSDSGSNTLIKNGSALYDSLSEMSVGNVVKFSGAISKAKNLTEEGKMTEPDFLFRFSMVEKVGDSISVK